MAKKTTSKKFSSTSEYISTLPDASRTLTMEVREIIREVMPGAGEAISYNMPSFTINGKSVIWYAAWKSHLSIYPLTAAMEKNIEGLAAYKGAKNAMQMPIGSTLPVALIRKMVKARLQEVGDKK